MKYQIEDLEHAEPINGEFKSFEEAFDVLIELSKIPWNEMPNKVLFQS